MLNYKAITSNRASLKRGAFMFIERQKRVTDAIINYLNSEDIEFKEIPEGNIIHLEIDSITDEQIKKIREIDSEMNPKEVIKVKMHNFTKQLDEVENENTR